MRRGIRNGEMKKHSASSAAGWIQGDLASLMLLQGIWGLLLRCKVRPCPYKLALEVCCTATLLRKALICRLSWKRIRFAVHLWGCVLYKNCSERQRPGQRSSFFVPWIHATVAGSTCVFDQPQVNELLCALLKHLWGDQVAQSRGHWACTAEFLGLNPSVASWWFQPYHQWLHTHKNP